MALQREGVTGPVDKKRLLHGTVDDWAAIRGICHNNVDFRLSGKNGTVYGDGAYFARDAKYSHCYTRGPIRSMLLSKVLVGQYKGDNSYRRPPARAGHTLYDSCINVMADPSIYVILDTAQRYP
ncbi:protein mono-ADP-ribosyltransferase PARP12-like [Gigantopelta aegis]|uniref:protein mono-ADP-ribosyltransferase PARP12-like n=1 Tax=Gigantopelta aegis TaxID=1735272 RepID=UPI001B887F8E|nr:protein mono-ADP-ribosyltransferase PARP12-like [Gigantopelta aegis]